MADEQTVPGVTKHSGTFKISVSDDNGNEIYANDSEAYEYEQVDSLPAAINRYGGDLTGDAISFLSEALAGEKNQAAVTEIVDLINGKLKANAKNSAYQTIANAKKPMSADDKRKAFDRMVDMFAKLNGVTVDEARKTLASLQTA